MSKRKVCIIGAGGSAKSIFQIIRLMGAEDEIVAFLETDDQYKARKLYGLPVKPLSFFDSSLYQAFISVGSSEDRAFLKHLLPPETNYASFIYPDALFLSPEDTEIGEGSIIYPGCIFSSHLSIGKHALILANSVFGHDSCIGDYFTAGVGFNMGGDCQIGNQVQCGMSVSIRNNTSINDGAFLGMGAVVMKNISEPGVYIGNPARKAK